MINYMLNQTQRITNRNLLSFMSPERGRYFGVTGGPPNILQIILFCVRLIWLAFKRKLTCMLLGGKVNTLLKLQSYFTCQDRFFSTSQQFSHSQPSKANWFWGTNARNLWRQIYSPFDIKNYSAKQRQIIQFLIKHFLYFMRYNFFL